MLRRHVSNSVFQHDFVVLDGRHLADIIAEGSTQRLVEVMLRQGVGLYSLSPYVVNGPVPERMFFGREQEVKVISQNLVDRDYAVLGGRRIGKSSILQRLDRLLSADPRYFALYINCEDKMDRREFLEALAGNLGVELDSAESRSFRDVVVPFIKANRAKRLVFLLDEIDELLAREAEAPDGPRLFKTFRGLSHEGTCRFVFSGSRTLYSHLHDSRSPFFNFCDSLILRPLDEKSVTEIVTKPMRQLGIDIPEEEQFIQRLVTLTSSHPNLTQWVCDRLVKRAFEKLGAGEPAVLDQLTEALRSNRRTSLHDLEELSRTRDFHESLRQHGVGGCRSARASDQPADAGPRVHRPRGSGGAQALRRHRRRVNQRIPRHPRVVLAHRKRGAALSVSLDGVSATGAGVRRNPLAAPFCRERARKRNAWPSPTDQLIRRAPSS